MSREIFDLGRGWRYRDSVPPGFAAPDFDDSTWEQVCVPHANRVLPWHSFDDADIRFVSAYRRRVRVPDHDAGHRVFVDFDGVMTAATVLVNGVSLGEHRGGYVPFSREITDHLSSGSDAVLALEVDSTERTDIPPSGGRVDYLPFGGIYRDVTLRVVPDVFITDVFAKPVGVLGDGRRVEVSCVIDAGHSSGHALRVETVLTDDAGALVTASRELNVLPAGQRSIDLVLNDLGSIELWDVDRPRLYDVTVRLHDAAGPVDEHTVRIGFREAQFTPDGFFLNGRRLELRGLNRHQTYPFVGNAMPARVQKRDADIVRHELKCNVVRTSHYPQSPHFLDRCDEIGLLVVTEIPGWSHIGDDAWKELACRDTEAMVRRDRNHPSVILWGVRINESPDDHDLYTRTNEIARALDGSRPTGGIRNVAESDLLEDVFTINDFQPDTLRAPHHPRYLNTEFVGHMWPTKPYDHVDRVQEHLLRHARVLDQLAGDDRYAGGIGWCAFDYNTHAYSGSGDRVCYHGIADIFRIPKPAAALYRSQCDPAEEVVLEPAFVWARGEFHWQVAQYHRETGHGRFRGIAGPGDAVICSNCDELRIYFGDELLVELEPDRKSFPNLAHPPFVTDALAQRWGTRWRDLRIEGYHDNRLVATRLMSARGVDAELHVVPDDAVLDADGRDATRVVLRVTDEYGNPRPYSTGAVSLVVEGPGELIGENPFALVGGAGAVWLRATETEGTITLRARHAVLGDRSIDITARPAPGLDI